MWERDSMGIRSLCKCRCGQGIFTARTIKTRVNDGMISEVERVVGVSIAAPSASCRGLPCPVANKENKKKVAAAEAHSVAAATEARELMRRARAKEEIERKCEAEEEQRLHARKEKAREKEKDKVEKAAAREREREEKHGLWCRVSPHTCPSHHEW